MGRFIVSRTAAGVRFLLQSDKGRALAVSKEYATLDACKKGICSLVYFAPIIPVIDLSRGESGPNPKFEIDADEKGFSFAMKSANGKSVITAPGFATRKACLRAISMLRTGVLGAEVVFANPAGYTPLTVGGMVRDPAPQEKPIALPDPAVEAVSEVEIADEPTAQETAEAEEFAAIPAEVSPAPHSAAPAPAAEPRQESKAPAPRVPRRVQIPGVGSIRRVPTASAEKTPAAKSKGGGVFAKIFKR